MRSARPVPRRASARGSALNPDPDPARRLAALAILGAFLLPASLTEHGPVLCPVRAATGFPCPACGLTRSWRSALHGDPKASLRFHPLGMVALLGAAAYAARLDERIDPAIRARAAAAGPILVAVWLGTWLVRLARTARSRSAGVIARTPGVRPA